MSKSEMKPREIKFKSYLEPEGVSFVYKVAECTKDIYTQEREWHFIEHSAYVAALELIERLEIMLKESATQANIETNGKKFYEGDGYFFILKQCRFSLADIKKFREGL